MPKTKQVHYEELGTLNSWQVALIDVALEHAVKSGAISSLREKDASDTLEQWRRIARPGNIVRFR